MHCLIVLAHPEPRSFNSQLAQVAVETMKSMGHTVELLDLYGNDFDPREALRHYVNPAEPKYFNAMDEQRHAVNSGTLPSEIKHALEQLDRADLVLFQFPLWWWSMPAILKGWLDRVLVWGGAYTSTKRYDRGHFRGKRALLSVTVGASEIAYGPDGRCGDLDLILWPTHFCLYYVGFSIVPPFRSFDILAKTSEPNTLAHLTKCKLEWQAYLRAFETLNPLKFNGWDDFDGRGRLKPQAPSYGPFIRH